MKPKTTKKSPEKEPVLKTDLSFDELIEGAFYDKEIKTPLPEKQKGFKKRNGEIPNQNGTIQNRDGK